ncbi:MAG: serine/threonine protein kinase [Proteobacteria bacterium]|nr:serine/threonine protein kinase [Pseudomonadota bacterium]
MHSERTEQQQRDRIKGYRLCERIGAGATGVVYAAERLADGLPVAIKMLRCAVASQPELSRRLLREAEVGRTVSHPGVPTTLAADRRPDGSPFLVMPRLTGSSLASLLRRGRIPDVPTIAALAARVAEILHAVHVAGYTHRDVKPEHIVLERDGDKRVRVYLIDFGVCASSRSSHEERELERGKVFGTPSYVSPEQASGDPEVDGRADLFSLGLVIHEALTGRPVFEGGNVTKLLLRIIHQDVPGLAEMLPNVDPEFARAAATLLTRDRAQRMPSARAAARALARFAGPNARAHELLLALLADQPIVVSAPAVLMPESLVAA